MKIFPCYTLCATKQATAATAFVYRKLPSLQQRPSRILSQANTSSARQFCRSSFVHLHGAIPYLLFHRQFSTSPNVNMPPKKAASKRKASASPSSPSKKSKSNGTTNGKSKSASNGSKNSDQYKDSTVEIEHGIVQREFYPPEMVNSRCIAYIEDEIERPIETLQAAVEETNDARDKIEVKDAVLHWFKCDLRTKDNRALSLASQKAKEAGVPLIAMYIVSPQDFQAHLTAPVRVDFILRTLEVLKEDLAKLDIPLYVETVEKRRNVPGRILDLCTEWGVSHIFANMEYEVDELRREAKLTGQCLEKGIALTVVHDTCVVPPGNLHSQSSGKDFAVYSPWYRAWMAHVQANQDLLEEFDVPAKNPGDAKKKFKSIFESEIPEAPENKKLTDAEKKRFGSMWPAGEKEAHHRLEKFLSQKIKTYDENRNLPAGNGTAVLSLHFASGTLSARTAVREAREANSTKKLNGGNSGIASWISEVAWRDFYKHVLVNWPFVW